MEVEPRFGVYKPSYDRAAKVQAEAANELSPADGAKMSKEEASSSSGIWATRKANLLWLRDKFREKREQDYPGHSLRGMEKEFAESIGMSSAYLGHVWAERRNIGNQLARQIEHSCHLPVGYLDHDHRTVMTPDEDAKEFVEQALALFREDPNGARRMLLKALTESRANAARRVPDVSKQVFPGKSSEK